MKKSNYVLRLQPSLMEELRKAAKEDQTTINQLMRANARSGEILSGERRSRGVATPWRGGHSDSARRWRRLMDLLVPERGFEPPTY